MRTGLSYPSILFACCLLLLPGCRTFSPDPECLEVVNSMSLNGERVHPELVGEFACWISDTKPITHKVDVRAHFDTNEYFEEFHVTDGWVSTKSGDDLVGYRIVKSDYPYVTVEYFSAGDGRGTLTVEWRFVLKVSRGREFYDWDESYLPLFLELVRVEKVKHVEGRM